jgi:hypothetical protein
LSIFSGNGGGSGVERDVEVLGLTAEAVNDGEFGVEDEAISDVELCLSKIRPRNPVLVQDDYLALRTASEPPTLPPIVAQTTTDKIAMKIQKLRFRRPRMVSSRYIAPA